MNGDIKTYFTVKELERAIVYTDLHGCSQIYIRFSSASGIGVAKHISQSPDSPEVDITDYGAW